MAKKIQPRTTGYYQCTECGNIEEMEREVRCWECGEGEMVWVEHRYLALVPDEEGGSDE